MPPKTPAPPASGKGSKPGDKNKGNDKPEEEMATKKADEKAIECGCSRLEFSNGAYYEGEWRVIDGIKRRHGKGRMVHGGEYYQGTFLKGEMTGQGRRSYAVIFACFVNVVV
jgi:hypothetical protein